MEINDENVKIKITFPKKITKLLANATVSLNTVEYGFITIKGFQIWPSPNMNTRLQEQINITPPSRQIYGKYMTFVYIENPESWQRLEERIYDAYHLAKTKNDPGTKMSEDI